MSLGIRTRIAGAYSHIRQGRLSLNVKLSGIVIAIVLVGVVVPSTAWLLLQRRQIVANARDQATHLNRAIEATLQVAMVDDGLQVARAMVRNLQETRSTQRMRILGTDGQVRISSVQSEEGIRLTVNDRLCQTCHAGGAAPRSETAIIRDPGGRETLLTMTAIGNQPACAGCHDPGARNLGLLLTESSLAGVNRELQLGAWGILVTAALVMLFLLITLARALSRLVTRPLQRLARGLAAVGSGDLEHGVCIRSDDELGQLARAFDDMRRSLQASRADVQRRNDDLALLNCVALAASQAQGIQEVLDQTLRAVVDGMGLEFGSIFLPNPATGEYERRANYRMPERLRSELEQRRRQQTQAAVAAIVASGRMYFVPDISSDHLFDGLWPDPEGRSLVNMPLRARGAVSGTVSLLSRAGRPLTAHDIEVLNNVAYVIGVAIEKAQLQEKMRYVGTLEERDRLGRELHDNLAQTLGYLKIRAGLAGRQLAEGHNAEALAGLADLKDKVQVAYVDVREAIFNLRTTPAGDVRLVPNLRDYLAEYRSYYGVEAGLDSDGVEGIEITPEAQLHVLRIVQEALSNVRKHARATHAMVRLRLEGQEIVVRIEDDGQGFDPASTDAGSGQRFGLKVMAERAGSVGGTLRVTTRPGAGTQVELRLPRPA